jgi:hypothetical protein
MATMNCTLIKSSLIDYLKQEVEVTSTKDKCVITLPIKTLDDRYIDVVVESKLEDYFVVHDAGKTLNELFSQGISLTDIKKSNLSTMAKKLGAELQGDIFTTGCKVNGIQNSILAISQCASLAMFELLGHRPEFEEESLSSRVAKTLNVWRPAYIISIDRGITVKGRRYPHRLDFVAVASSDNGHPTSAVKLLPPTYSGQVQAERYAYLVLDLERTTYEKWKRVAVLTKAEMWPIKALQMVRELSNATLELRTGEEPSIREQLPEKMNLAVAAEQ